MVFQSFYGPDFNVCDRSLFRELKKRIGTVSYKSHTEYDEAIKSDFHSIREDLKKNKSLSFSNTVKQSLIIVVIMSLTSTVLSFSLHLQF